MEGCEGGYGKKNWVAFFPTSYSPLHRFFWGVGTKKKINPFGCLAAVQYNIVQKVAISKVSKINSKQKHYGIL